VAGVARPRFLKPRRPYGAAQPPREGLHHAAGPPTGMPLSSGGLISP
jgi:hypothetical protein